MFCKAKRHKLYPKVFSDIRKAFWIFEKPSGYSKSLSDIRKAEKSSDIRKAFWITESHIRKLFRVSETTFSDMGSGVKEFTPDFISYPKTFCFAAVVVVVGFCLFVCISKCSSYQTKHVGFGIQDKTQLVNSSTLQPFS